MIYYHSSNQMPELSDSSIHCVVTSPPYPMICKWDDSFKKQGAFDWVKQIGIIWNSIKECIRVLIPGGILCMNVGDATRHNGSNFVCYPNYAYLTTLLALHKDINPLIPILWKKISNRPNAFLGSGFLPVNAYVSQDCEYIGIYRKGDNRTFVGEEKERRKASAFTKDERDLWFRQVWEGIPGKRGAKEDSGWNLEIPYRLVRMFSIVGDTILDPFCGTVGGKQFEELCEQHGRHFIGYTL